MSYTDNPIADHNRHEAKQEAWLKSRPVCSECSKPIQDEFCYEFDDKVICEQCLMDNHHKYTEDFCE